MRTSAWTGVGFAMIGGAYAVWAELGLSGSAQLLGLFLLLEAAGFAAIAAGFLRAGHGSPARFAAAGAGMVAVGEVYFLAHFAATPDPVFLGLNVLGLVGAGVLAWGAVKAWRDDAQHLHEVGSALRPGLAVMLVALVGSILSDIPAATTFLLGGYLLAVPGWAVLAWTLMLPSQQAVKGSGAARDSGAPATMPGR